MPSISPIILNECARRLLRPIIKFCLSNGLKLQDITEFLKLEFVEAAKNEIVSKQEQPSVSKISVMTGVHRPDVIRIIDSQGEVKESKNQIVRIVGHWQHSKKFCNSNGKPKIIDIQGKNSEFVKLVQSVSADLNPYTVLFELERSGLAERTSKGLKLISKLYIPKNNVQAGFDLLSKDIEDLVFAVSENIFENPEYPNLHLRTEYDNIPESFIEPIRKWLLEEGSAVHRKARKFLSSKDSDFEPNIKLNSEKSIKVTFGTFTRIEKAK